MGKETGGQAFPVAGGEHNYPVEGMTLRDYLAAKAMAAIISTNPKCHVSEVSRVAFMAADAMIMERNK